MSQRPTLTPPTGRQSPRSSPAFFTPRTGLQSPRSSQAYVTVPTGRQSPRSSQAYVTPRTGLQTPRTFKPYFTVPTGRRSPPSSSSSISSSRSRKPSHATIRRRRSRTNPMKLSLNLALNVQPLKSDREQCFSLNESFGDNDVFYSESSGTNNGQRYRGRSEKRTFRRSDGSDGGVSGAESSSDSHSSQGSALNKRKIHRTRKVSSLKKPRTKSLGASVRFRDTCPRRLSSNGSVTRVSGAESSASRSSQGSLKDKRKVQTTGNRKNKQPLYSSSLEKPRSKSLTAIPGFQPYSRPRRLSFNDSDADGEAVEIIKSDADKTFPSEKSFQNSLGLDDTLPVARLLSFNDSTDKQRGVVAVELKPSDSRSSQGSLRKVRSTGNRYKNKRSLLTFSSLKKPRSKSVRTSLGFNGTPSRRLSFDEVFGTKSPNPTMGDVAAKSSESRTSRSSHDSTKDKKKTPGSPYRNRRSSLKKPRTSLGFVGIPPSRSSSNGSVINVSGAESSASRSSQGSLRKVRSSGNRYKNKQSLLTFSSLKKPRSKSLGTSSKLELPHALSSNAQVFGAKSSNSAIGLNDNNVRSSLGLNTSVVSANLDATGSKSSQIFNHQRSVRIGFIANNIPMAVNCLVNIRSDQENLYVKPVEVLYEGFKIWRRPVREVQKEIGGKLAADKKN